jgi:hypothetical protein
MYRTLLFASALVLAIATTPAFAQAVVSPSISAPTTAHFPLAALQGEWVGTLEYRDFQSDRRVTLPTKLSATPGAGGIAMAYTYDDGPGKIVRDGFTLSVDAKEAIFAKTDGDGASLYRIIGDMAPKAGAPLRWTLWGKGTENDKPVDVRETLTLTAREFTLLRETRPTGSGAAYLFRHEYRLARIGG